MQEKLQWATRSASDIVIKEPVDEEAIKHAFWGYLQAYQQILNYYAKWLKQTGKGSFNHSMDAWKVGFLSQEEAETWDLLNAFRNEDMHEDPITPDISIKTLVLSLNGKATVFNQRYLINMGTKQVIVLNYQGKEYRLASICGLGLKAMQQLIDTFDQVSSPSTLQ